MIASVHNLRAHLILSASMIYLIILAAVSRGMRHLIRLCVVIPIVWLSLLCGASWTSAPQRFLEQHPTSSPYTTLRRDVTPANIKIFALGESDSTEELRDRRGEPDEDEDEAAEPDIAGRVASRGELLAYLHSGLSPPSRRARPPHPSTDRPLTSAHLLSSADARAPPQR